VVHHRPEYLPVIEQARVGLFGDHELADTIVGVEALARPGYLIGSTRSHCSTDELRRDSSDDPTGICHPGRSGTRKAPYPALPNGVPFGYKWSYCVAAALPAGAWPV
jgi:hypothetical protein